MGRDDVPAELSLSDDKQLVARFPAGGFRTLAEEERVMRAIADQLGGTLRSNPLWSFARQPVTAHSHGGCALCLVTDPWGQVNGFPNLFINDGSLLPRPVGVNPSSTIAAIAERNIRHFTLNVLRRRLPSAWKSHIAAARRWASDQDQKQVKLEPPDAKSIYLEHGTVGFAFAEKMSGHMMLLDHPDRMHLPTSKERIRLAPFLRAEGDARFRKLEVSFSLTATSTDVAAFLDDPGHAVQLDGSLDFAPGLLGQHPVSVKDVKGTLSLLVNLAPGRRLMVYELPFTHADQDWTLIGEKEIQDDPGFDAWLDASTLYVELCPGKVKKGELALDLLSGQDRPRTEAVARGILRLGLRDFVIDQLQNSRAIGTEDPARIVWTLGSFGVFFFGTMQGSYAPEIERFLSLLGRSSWRSTSVGSEQRDDPGVFRILECV
jgi:cholesterol oxidase